jgi:sugar-specific transcriptional regulator TrmB
MEEETLQEIGLTRGESKVYLSLLKNGRLTTGPIAKYSGITHSKVYKILDKLSNRGLISSILVGKIKHFKASDPKEVLKIIKEKQNSLRTIEETYTKQLPFLEEISKNSGLKSNAEVFEGFKGMKSVFDEILGVMRRGEELLTIGISPTEGEIRNYFYHFYKKQEKAGFRIKAIFNNSSRHLAKERKNKYTNFKFMPTEAITPAIINIYGDKTIINTRSEKEAFFTIVITSKETADSFKHYFNLLWKIAKK